MKFVDMDQSLAALQGKDTDADELLDEAERQSLAIIDATERKLQQTLQARRRSAFGNGEAAGKTGRRGRVTRQPKCAPPSPTSRRLAMPTSSSAHLAPQTPRPAPLLQVEGEGNGERRSARVPLARRQVDAELGDDAHGAGQDSESSFDRQARA